MGAQRDVAAAREAPLARVLGVTVPYGEEPDGFHNPVILSHRSIASPAGCR
jgi:hypothetical protein